MKHIFCLLFLCLLLGIGASACAEKAVPCYWQLESIQSSSTSSNRYGPAQASCDVTPVSDLSAREMVEAVRGSRTLSLDLVRDFNGLRAHGDYTLSGIPALIPGSAGAHIAITASTRSENETFYLYTVVNVNGTRVLRVRDTGAWVFRVSFPRTAVPGAYRRLEIEASELNGLAKTTVSYLYRAIPGKMLIDSNGDIVLYDPQGNEIDRIAKTVDDILPTFAAGSTSTVFSAEVQKDGSLIARFDPHSGMAVEEIIRLLRSAQSAVPSDAVSSGTVLSSIIPSKTYATLYLAPNTPLSDDVLALLIRAASGQSVSVASLQDAIASGEASLTSDQTTPKPLSFSELMNSLDTLKTTPVPPVSAAHKEAQNAQTLALYGENGAIAAAFAPDSHADGTELHEIALAIGQAENSQEAYERLFGTDAEAFGLTDTEKALRFEPAEPGAAAVSISRIEGSTLLTIQPGSVSTLLRALEDLLVALNATPTAVPTFTPTVAPTATPTAAPTATPTAAPTATPTAAPTPTPTTVPTATPTAAPTPTPTAAPTATPTAAPTPTPTAAPTATPTTAPTVTPTAAPTPTPTTAPTAAPTTAPTPTPTTAPTAAPTLSPTTVPTAIPTAQPTATPLPLSSVDSFHLPAFVIAFVLILLIIALLIVVFRKMRRKDD